MFRLLITCCVSTCAFIATTLTAQAAQVDYTLYDVYYGDFNHDGQTNDVYLHGKNSIVLIHGDIIVPLVLKGPEGLVYYEGGGAKALTLQSAALSAYTQATLGADYVFRDANGDGLIDIVVDDLSGSGETVFLNSRHNTFHVERFVGAFPSGSNYIRYRYDALGRLITVTDPNNGDRAYDYDAAGNRTTVTSD